jgi:hypothetical protein
LPVPDSPSTSTVAAEGATLRMRSNTSRIAGLLPTIPLTECVCSTSRLSAAFCFASRPVFRMRSTCSSSSSWSNGLAR